MRNTGLSARLSRIHIETARRMIETRNGTRQPHAANAVSPIAVRVPMTTSSAANSPSVAVVWMKLVNSPRLFGGANSAT